MEEQRRSATGHVPGSIRVRLLGDFCLVVDGRDIACPVRAQQVIGRLALSTRPMSRAALASTFWPDRPEERAGACLRSVLWRIGKIAEGAVRSNQRVVWLEPSASVDVCDLVTTVRRLEVDPSDVVVDQALLGGDLLPDWDVEWLDVERARVRELRLYALELLCRARAASGRHVEAVEAGYAAIAAEPLRESAHAALIAAHLAAGNRYAAVRQFEQCCDLLDTELGLRPSDELIASIEAVGRHHP